MSIEANTFERITVNNVNEKTKGIVEAFGRYLLETWGICFLDMDVDGKKYQTEDDTISENSALADVCKKLGDAKSVSASLRSCNAGGFEWRRESQFLPLLVDDEEVRNYVVYKSTDYYDTDTCVDLYSFGKNGVEEKKYNSDPSTVSDIREWYCYTYDIIFKSEDGFGDNIRKSIFDLLRQFAVEYCDLNEDSITDDGCELYIEGSLRFKTESIPMMTGLLQKTVDAMDGIDDASCEIMINAIPNGENDYDFASVRFELKDGKVEVSYCRY